MIEFATSKNYLPGVAKGMSIQGITHDMRGNHEEALTLFNKCVELNRQTGDRQGVASALNNIGTIHRHHGNFVSSLNFYQQSLDIYNQVGSIQGQAKVLLNLGNIYWQMGDYPKALQYYMQSLPLKEVVNDVNGIGRLFNNIGAIYNHMGDMERAIEYYQKGMAISEQTNDLDGIASAKSNLGVTLLAQGSYTQALRELEQSKTIREQLGDIRGVAICNANIGKLYSEKGDLDQGMQYFLEDLALNEKMKDRSRIASSMANIGRAYFDLKSFDQAITYCKTALNMAEELSAVPTQKPACQCLYESYKAIGKGAEALVYLEKLAKIDLQLQKEETSKQLDRMEFRKVMLQDSIAKAAEAQLVQEAHQSEIRKKIQTRNTAYVGAVFFLLLAAGFYSRWRYVRRSKAIIEKERDRSDNLLLNILPAEIAAELKEKGRADARDFDMVSILFTDFKGFTEASAKLSAQDLVAEINTCFEAFDGIMAKYNIEKIKTIGDAYMAAGGLPVPTDDSVKNTVLAALEMQDFIVSRQAAKSAKGESAFEMRVGIHTGPVVAGIVGVKKFQYDIWGDTVNTASRMESSGEVGKVNISAATYELIKDDFNCEFRGEIEAKGKGKLGMLFVKSRK